MSGVMSFIGSNTGAGLVFQKPRLHSAMRMTNEGPRTVWCVSSDLRTPHGSLRILSYWKLSWQEAYASWLGELGRCFMLHSQELAKVLLNGY